jgi:hypothetical protein
MSRASKLIFLGLIALLMAMAFLDMPSARPGRGILSAFLYIFMAVMLAAAFLLMEVIAKPTTVYILRDGAVLVFRGGDQRFIPWDQWEWVVVNYRTRNSRLHSIDFGGKARIRGRTLSFWTTFEIARDLQ